MLYEHNIQPYFLKIESLGLEMRWYGLMYLFGFIFTFLFLRNLWKKGKIDFEEEEIYDCVFYIFLGLTLGARFFYAIFYNLKYYLEYPYKVFFIWEGGMSFHGGLVGVSIAIFLFAKKYKKSILNIGDIIAIPASFALGLGRIGNFINGELWGRCTDQSWGVFFPNAGPKCVYRHPSQIYEFLKNEFIFLVLLFLFFKLKDRKDGLIFSIFLILIGILRFLVEFIREPEIVKEIAFGIELTMGQILSLPLVFIGFYLIFRIYRRKW